MVKVIVDGRFVTDEADLHRRLAGAFGYGPHYRHDLDSLRERLSAGDPRPVELVWIYTESLRMAIGTAAFDEFVAALEQIAANDGDRDWPDRFVFRIFD
jgi:RNAse (barnase) inhibitor barstar